MKVLKFNISKPRKYTDGAGNEKTQWSQIGVITEFHKDDGSVGRIIEIPAIGLEANIFPFQPKEGQEQQTQQTQQQPAQKEPTVRYDEGEVRAEDIPF